MYLPFWSAMNNILFVYLYSVYLIIIKYTSVNNVIKLALIKFLNWIIYLNNLSNNGFSFLNKQFSPFPGPVTVYITMPEWINLLYHKKYLNFLLLKSTFWQNYFENIIFFSIIIIFFI